jgi:hypothetical protein
MPPSKVLATCLVQQGPVGSEELFVGMDLRNSSPPWLGQLEHNPAGCSS